MECVSKNNMEVIAFDLHLTEDPVDSATSWYCSIPGEELRVSKYSHHRTVLQLSNSKKKWAEFPKITQLELRWHPLSRPRLELWSQTSHLVTKYLDKSTFESKQTSYFRYTRILGKKGCSLWRIFDAFWPQQLSTIPTTNRIVLNPITLTESSSLMIWLEGLSWALGWVIRLS